MDLGKKIKQAREEADLDAIEFLYRLRKLHPSLKNTQPGSLSTWENGHVSRISFHAIDAIAHITGKPLSYFSELSDEPPGDEKPEPPHHGDPRNDSGDVLESVEQRRKGQAGQSRRRTRD